MENTILIIDDNRETLDVLTSLFLQTGWMVQRALSGEQGLDAVRRHLPSLVISDLAMPGLSGFDFAEAMRETYGAKCPIMVALTGWSDSGVAKQALEAGFSIVLTKPVDFEHLLSVVKLAAINPSDRITLGNAAADAF